jgi:hypothetical protein
MSNENVDSKWFGKVALLELRGHGCLLRSRFKVGCAWEKFWSSTCRAAVDKTTNFLTRENFNVYFFSIFEIVHVL